MTMTDVSTTNRFLPPSLHLAFPGPVAGLLAEFVLQLDRSGDAFLVAVSGPDDVEYVCRVTHDVRVLFLIVFKQWPEHARGNDRRTLQLPWRDE